MEMISTQKDKKFIDQIRYANPEVRDQFNALMLGTTVEHDIEEGA